MEKDKFNKNSLHIVTDFDVKMQTFKKQSEAKCKEEDKRDRRNFIKSAIIASAFVGSVVVFDRYVDVPVVDEILQGLNDGHKQWYGPHSFSDVTAEASPQTTPQSE